MALTRARARAPGAQPPPRKVYTSEDAVRVKLANTVRGCCGAGAAPQSVLGRVWSLVSGALGQDEPPAARSRMRRSMSSRIAVETEQAQEDED